MTATFKIEDLNLSLVDVHGIPQATGRVAAFQAIADAFKRNELPSEELMDWFCSSVEELAADYAENSSPSVKQRLISRSFGFTPKQGSKTSQQNGYAMAKDICVIRLSEECGDEEAIERYVERRLKHCKGDPFDAVRRTYYRYKSAAEPAAEAWIELQEEVTLILPE